MQQLFGECHSELPSVQKKSRAVKVSPLLFPVHLYSKTLISTGNDLQSELFLSRFLWLDLNGSYLSLMLPPYQSFRRNVASVGNKWRSRHLSDALALEMGIVWFPKEESAHRQTPSASKCVGRRWNWHCQRCRGKWTSRLRRWIFCIHWRPPRLNLSSHWLALIYVAYVDCNAIHSGKLPLSYAWAKAHTAADGQLSVCACVTTRVKDWVHVYVCVCFRISIFVRAVFSFRP